ncbi:MAG: DNA polymerase III subunit delta' [Kiritimatiellaeota bacterium]|nr:DNA polymerase III subunit delta' [Kiritimatiellota bacterium]
MSFEPEVEQALALLRQSLASGRLAHAYLIVGSPRGAAGVLAERVVALLYCTAPGERPCGQCAKCRQIAAHTHPDVLWVEPQKKSRGILMAQIEAVQEHINLTSFEGGWKAVVFRNADRINPQAANRLLKTLEEPPDKCLFLLVTDQPAALLPTVVSRCQRVVLAAEATVSGVALRAAVIDAMTGTEGRSLVAAVERSRKVLGVLKQVREEIEETVDADEHTETQASEELKAAKEIREARIESLYKETLAELFRWLLLWQRDVLLRVVGANGPAAPAFPDQVKAIQQQAVALTCRRALANINTIEDMRWQVAQNLSVPMVMERGFIRLTATGTPEDRRRTPDA